MSTAYQQPQQRCSNSFKARRSHWQLVNIDSGWAVERVDLSPDGENREISSRKRRWL